MNTKTILADLDASFENLEKTVSNFPDASFAVPSIEGTWSAAQVCEHLLMLERIALQALNGTAIPTNRPADNKVAIIKWAMEDETKREAPPVVKPIGNASSKDDLLQQLKAERERLKAAVQSLDVTEACTGLKHPALGTLTRWEWVNFIIHHMERHRKQIERLKINGVNAL